MQPSNEYLFIESKTENSQLWMKSLRKPHLRIVIVAVLLIVILQIPLLAADSICTVSLLLVYAALLPIFILGICNYRYLPEMAISENEIITNYSGPVKFLKETTFIETEKLSLNSIRGISVSLFFTEKGTNRHIYQLVLKTESPTRPLLLVFKVVDIESCLRIIIPRLPSEVEWEIKEDEVERIYDDLLKRIKDHSID